MKYSIILILLLIPLMAFADSGVSGVFKNIWEGIKYVWNSYILFWFNNIWQVIYNFLGTQVEQRKPGVEDEFKKETQEMKEDIPNVWQKIKNLF